MFLAYLGYQLLMMKIRKNDTIDTRFQVIEQHIESLEQNTTSLTDQTTDLAESIFAIQAKIDSVLEESGFQQQELQVLTKFLVNWQKEAGPPGPNKASKLFSELKAIRTQGESTPTA
jgi:peptidoglycan hydrolase CwlO-like protein